MILISHRGNINGVEGNENSPEYIDRAITNGYNVEIDIRKINNKYFLGHDEPDFEINFSWLYLRKDKLWIHAKNFEALSGLMHSNLRIFFHEKENHTIIHNSFNIWSHMLSEANELSIIPLLLINDIKQINKYNVYGVCSDFVSLVK